MHVVRQMHKGVQMLLETKNMNLPKISESSEGLQIIEKESGYNQIELQDIFNKINVQYNKETDTFLLNIDSNLIIKSSNEYVLECVRNLFSAIDRGIPRKAANAFTEGN